MSDKIQMTEEQARKFFADIFWDYFDSESETLTALNTAKEKGYIIKSELQQKVEEAEEKHKAWFKREQLSNEFDCYHITCLYDIIQLFKQSHPEFKK